MQLEVKVTDASVSDVVDVAVDWADEMVTTTTLADVIVKALLGRLATDPRWDALAERFWGAVDEQLRGAMPGFVDGLVAKEVARQLRGTGQGAVTRGKPSTAAEAVVATEVTTQLREQFAKVVQRRLAGLDRELELQAQQAVSEFRAGRGAGRRRHDDQPDDLPDGEILGWSDRGTTLKVQLDPRWCHPAGRSFRPLGL